MMSIYSYMERVFLVDAGEDFVLLVFLGGIASWSDFLGCIIDFE
jgi:hypothetical protein